MLNPLSLSKSKVKINNDKVRFDTTTSVADLADQEKMQKQKKKKKNNNMTTDFFEDDENGFRRYVQFVFKNRDVSRVMPPIYIVFY